MLKTLQFIPAASVTVANDNPVAPYVTGFHIWHGSEWKGGDPYETGFTVEEWSECNGKAGRYFYILNGIDELITTDWEDARAYALEAMRGLGFESAESTEALTDILTEYCSAQGLPLQSADELLHLDLTGDQRRRLSQFVDAWEIAQEREDLEQSAAMRGE